MVWRAPVPLQTDALYPGKKRLPRVNTGKPRTQCNGGWVRGLSNQLSSRASLKRTLRDAWATTGSIGGGQDKKKYGWHTPPPPPPPFSLLRPSSSWRGHLSYRAPGGGHPNYGLSCNSERLQVRQRWGPSTGRLEAQQLRRAQFCPSLPPRPTGSLWSVPPKEI